LQTAKEYLQGDTKRASGEQPICSDVLAETQQKSSFVAVLCSKDERSKYTAVKTD
jgi:hypothetical protein